MPMKLLEFILMGRLVVGLKEVMLDYGKVLQWTTWSSQHGRIVKSYSDRVCRNLKDNSLYFILYEKFPGRLREEGCLTQAIAINSLS